MFYPSFYESVRKVMVFKWMLICMIQVMNIFSPANLVHIIWCNITLNETLLHPMLTCTFHSPVRAVTSGLWHKGSHRQGCEIRALTVRGCDIRALFDSGLLCQGLMIFFIKLFFFLWHLEEENIGEPGLREAYLVCYARNICESNILAFC